MGVAECRRAWKCLKRLNVLASYQSGVLQELGIPRLLGKYGHWHRTGNPNQARKLVLSICTIQAMPKRSGRHAWRETLAELGKRQSCPMCKNR